MRVVTRTHVILDGLQDPAIARRLSAAWYDDGFVNAIDAAGQCAWLEPSKASGKDALDAEDMERAAGLARQFGLEPRERVGSEFQPANDLAQLREKIVHEYKSRFATALVYGLPALALHYLAPVLAGSGDTRSMVYPWLFEMILAGWVCVSAGWPIIWQGAAALLHLRLTGDALVTLVIIASWLPSALGLASMAVTHEPWLAPGAREPLFHATVMCVTLASLQRWLAHAAAGRLSGRGALLLPRFSRMVSLALLAAAVALTVRSWNWGVAVMLLTPPMLALGGASRLTPGWSAALPVIGFGVFLWFAPSAWGMQTHGREVEIAAGFQLLMVLVMNSAWRSWSPMGDLSVR